MNRSERVFGRHRQPPVVHRLAFIGVLSISLVAAWLTAWMWMLASYVGVVFPVARHVGGPALGWIAAALPQRAHPIALPSTFDWYTWGPDAVWETNAPPPANVLEVFTHAARLVGEGPAFETSVNSWVSYPVWWLVAVWIVCAWLVIRALWERSAQIERPDRLAGHLAHAGSLDLRVTALASVAALPMLALWRFERNLWEGAVLWGPVGRYASIEIYHGAHLLLLAQVVLLHWIIFWTIYERALRRELRTGRATVGPSHRRCLACGYDLGERGRLPPGHVCPECGQPADALPKRLRRFEWTGWKRRLLSTPAMIALLVVLFFSPAWLPFVT